MPGARGGVEVLDARDLPEQLLHRPGDALLDLRRRCAGQLDEDVDHRHDDLRLFLARQREHRQHAEGDRRDDDQRRQLRVDEGGGQPAGHARARCSSRRLPAGCAATPATRSARPSRQPGLRRIDHALAVGEAGDDFDDVAAGRAELHAGAGAPCRRRPRTRWSPGPGGRTAVAGTTSGLPRARPASGHARTCPDFRSRVRAASSLTRTARASASTARAISCTVAVTSVCRSRAIALVEQHRARCRRASRTPTPRLVDAHVESEPAGLLDSQQGRARAPPCCRAPRASR